MSYRFIILIVGVMIYTARGSAQKTQAPGSFSFLVNAGDTLNVVIPRSEIFCYDSFLPGKVHFKDGRIATSKLNYSRLLDEMLFINDDFDTVAIDEEATIKFITIGSDTFYYDGGYIRLIKNVNGLKLGEKQSFRMGDKRKESGYGMTSTSSSTSLSSLTDAKRVFDLKVKEQATVYRVTYYYVGDRYNQFVLATKKNVADHFPKHNIAPYCRKNKVRFDNAEDLKALVSYLAHASYHDN